MNKQKKIPIIIYIFFIIILIRLIFYYNMKEYTEAFDTSSYFQNYEGSILKACIDEQRTPVYPTVYKIFKSICGTDDITYRTIILMQEIVSIVSIAVLYKTFQSIFSSKKYVYILTILYGTCPMIFCYNKMLLTESFSISFMVMFVCLLISFNKKPSIKKNILIAIYTFFLIMLRPSFLYITVYLFIVWFLLFLNKEKRKQAIIGFALLITIVRRGICI